MCSKQEGLQEAFDNRGKPLPSEGSEKQVSRTIVKGSRVEHKIRRTHGTVLNPRVTLGRGVFVEVCWDGSGTSRPGTHVQADDLWLFDEQLPDDGTPIKAARITPQVDALIGELLHADIEPSEQAIADLQSIIDDPGYSDAFSNDELLALGIGCGVAGPLSDEQVIREASERLTEIEGESQTGAAASVERAAVQACSNLAEYLNSQEQWNGGDVCEVLAAELNKAGFEVKG